MCGITGFVGSYSPELLKKMSDRIRHRGPDSNGEWCNKEHGVGIAHRRLSIIDLSNTGAQPMWNQAKTAVIVFNGEIYNYKPLRDTLVGHGYTFRGTSDTEVLINLYQEYGVEMLQMLNGIFAFAIWDTLQKQLFVARDGMGVKPLYYSCTQKGFVFSSEMKSFTVLPEFDKSLDYDAIHYYLTYMWCPAPHTPFKNVKKLEPGNAIIIRNSKIEKKWQFYEVPISTGNSHTSVKAAIVACEEHIANAVNSQMVADVEVATFLSGGLDSTAITYFAQKSRPEQLLKSFTMRYNGNEMMQEGLVDDLPYATIAANALGVDLKVVDVENDFFAKLPFMIYSLDEPQSDPAPLNVFHICNHARQCGIKVLLSGAGGDDIFTGYRRHQALALHEMLGFIPREAYSAIGKMASVLPDHPALLRRIKKALYSASFSGPELFDSYLRWLPSDVQQTLYSGEFKRSLSLVSPVITSVAALPDKASMIDKMLFLEMKYFLADHNLNYTDKMSMATGVEVRVPFLDPNLVQFAFSLPSRYKQHGSIAKWIFKKTMEPYLPKNLIYRPKTGFGVPLRTIIKKENITICNDYLSYEAVNKRGLFDYANVKKMLEDNYSDKREAAYSIFSLVCLEIWMRIFIDGSYDFS